MLHKNDVPPERQSEIALGKAAEALIFLLLRDHSINDTLQFRPTSRYDDFLHGADVIVEPLHASLQGLATLDITINQEDIKGRNVRDPMAREARPVGLEAKLARTKRYTDHIASYDSGAARKLLGWINSGGLREKRTKENSRAFDDAERLFLMKYYKTSETSDQPHKAGYIIGGPQTVISVDTVFVNRALQGQGNAKEVLADIALLEFMYCIAAEKHYLDKLLSKREISNVFFDGHYAMIDGWSRLLSRSDVEDLSTRLANKHKQNREFISQLNLYAQAFSKVYGI